MSNNDPIVFPNGQGLAHHHTFYGNTSTTYNSNLNSLRATGNSTCNGGTMNKSAYWVPSMIDTATGTPLLPTGGVIFYYKVGASGVPAATIKPAPIGLRMIAGNAAATSEATSQATYTCISPVTSQGTGWQKSIPNCSVGWTMQMMVQFPQCWDGINLYKANSAHMAHASRSYTTANKCPTTHPTAIPSISVNFNYKISQPNQTVKWRLSSDNYATTLPGGYSAHADWVNGWNTDPTTGSSFMNVFVANCINKNLDCHAHLLGDGRMFY